MAVSNMSITKRYVKGGYNRSVFSSIEYSGKYRGVCWGNKICSINPVWGMKTMIRFSIFKAKAYTLGGYTLGCAVPHLGSLKFPWLSICFFTLKWQSGLYGSLSDVVTMITSVVTSIKHLPLVSFMWSGLEGMKVWYSQCFTTNYGIHSAVI